MKLAICSVGELFGGVERQILDLCRYLLRNDHSPLVILFHDGELASQLRNLGVEPVFLKVRHRYDWAVVGQLVEFLVAQGIQVVHVHGYKATITCGLARRRVPFRLVKTEHGKMESTFAKPISWMKTRFNFHLEQFITRRFVDQVCYVTNDIASYFDKSHSGMNRVTIHNGIDPINKTQFTRPADLPVEGLNLGIVGRVTRIKGIDLAIQAMAGSLSEHQVNLMIIGTGGMINKLEPLVESYGLSGRVKFLGFRRNIFEYLTHLDGLLMPSWHEGLPYTLLEAMALELPIVASDVGGIREVLVDKETAFLFKAGDISGIRKQIIEFEQNRDLGKQLAANAKNEMRDHYSLNRMGQDYRSVYNSIRPIGEGVI